MKNYLWWWPLALVVFSFTVVSSADAHEPRLVNGDQLILIDNPEISQAFYGELKDREAYFLIDLKQAADLYFQILVPDLPGILKDKTVAIGYTAELGRPAISFAKLEPDSMVWQKYYEEFAGDDYFKGPEITKPAEPGYYLIKISSPENIGKYVLAVGQKEEFGLREAARALITLPRLKKDFFNKPVWQGFNNKIGLYFGGGLLAVLLLGLMFYKFNQVYK